MLGGPGAVPCGRGPQPGIEPRPGLQRAFRISRCGQAFRFVGALTRVLTKGSHIHPFIDSDIYQILIDTPTHCTLCGRWKYRSPQGIDSMGENQVTSNR